MPEIKEDTNGIVTGPREYIFAVTKRWVNPDGKGIENGCDGWRLDVAFCIHHAFWKDWRKLVKGINPNSYMTAELIFNDPPEKLKPYIEGDEFDAIMNYNFAINCYEYFMADKTRVKVSAFDSKLGELRDSFPACVQYGMMNLMDSHDTNRFTSMILNADHVDMRDYSKYADYSKASMNKDYNTRKPGNEVYEKQSFVPYSR